MRPREGSCSLPVGGRYEINPTQDDFFANHRNCYGRYSDFSYQTSWCQLPGQNGRISFLEFNSVTRAADIYTINPDGSDERQLTSLSQNQFVANGAQWSPDGRQLVFPVVTNNPVPGQIWVMNADGSNQHAVFTDPNHIDFNTTFSPDGKHIWFHQVPA